MTDTWIDDSEIDGYLDSEDFWDDSFGEDFGEEFGEDAEASRTTRRQSARARQLALARRRRATELRGRQSARHRRRPSPPATRDRAAIRNVDLKQTVRTDELRSQLTAQAKRQSRSETAAVAGVIAGQIQSSFSSQLSNPFLRAAISVAPLFLLTPERRDTGAGALIRDPRVIGAAAVAGIAFASQRLAAGEPVRSIAVTAPTNLTQKDRVLLLADPLDARGVPVSGATVTWDSTDPKVAAVDPNTGLLDAGTAGTAIITASVAGGPLRRVLVTVT